MSLGTEVDTELKHTFQRFKTERPDSERFKFMAYLTPFLSKISVKFAVNDPNLQKVLGRVGRFTSLSQLFQIKQFFFWGLPLHVNDMMSYVNNYKVG